MVKKKGFEIKDVKERSHGMWDSIFPQFAITMPPKRRHAPCPACGGEDRFYYDDKLGFGDFFCNGCGAGDGFALISRVCEDLSFPKIIEEVASIVGLSADSQITDVERAEMRKQAKLREQRHQQEKLKKQENTAKKALRLWNNTHVSEDQCCPYLDRKKVQNFDCLINFDGDLIVPLYDEKRVLWNLQYIKPDGSKTFLSDGRKKGCFHFIGTVELADPVICIVEGYATGASIHMATGLPVVIAFDAFNLLPVGQNIHKMEPNAKLIYCADDDSAKEDTGRKCAEEAVAVTGGIVIIPNFEHEATV